MRFIVSTLLLPVCRRIASHAGDSFRSAMCLLVVAAGFSFVENAAASPSSQDSVTVTTTYEYDEVNLMPRAVEVVSSDGSRRRTETTYAHEVYTGTTGMGVSGSHQLAAVYETFVRTTSSSLPLACSRTLFKPLAGGGRVPEYVSEGCGDERKTMTHFVEYDAYGRPTLIWQAPGLRGLIDYEGRHIVGITRKFQRYFGSTVYDIELKQTFAYNNLGRLTSATDENGTTLHYSYDGFGRLTQVARSLYTGGPPGLVPVPLAEYEYYLSAAVNGTYFPNLPNFVRTRIFADGGVEPDQSTVFFDGLGRELQSQQVVDAGTVAVSFPEYDALGRPHRQWRPVEMQSSDGASGGHGFIPILDVRNAALGHYAEMPGNETGGGGGVGIGIDHNRPHSSITYEDNPFSRASRVRAPGTTVDGTYSGSGQAGEYSYGVGSARVGTPSMAYTEVRDADDRWTRTYTDGLGRERFVVRGRAGVSHTVTALIYNAADRLIQVRSPNYYDEIVPEVADPHPIEPSAPGFIETMNWVTNYFYDTRGQLLRKTTPDTQNTAETGPGQHRYLYDKYGRLRYSQDPEQRARGQVAFTRYDAVGRPVLQGVGRPAVCDSAYMDDPSAPEACWGSVAQHLIDGTRFTDILDPECEDDTGQPCQWDWAGSNSRTMYHYDDATQTVVDNGTNVIRVERWPFYGDSSFEYTNTAGRLVAVAHRTEGLWQSGSSPRWQATHFAYDESGNVSERWTRVRISSATPWDRFTYSYDRQGRPTAESVEVGPYELHHFYTYDRRGLRTEVRASTDGTVQAEADLVLEYGIDGAVAARNLGNGAAQLSYTYDVAGRLVDIGNVEATGDEPFAARYRYTPGGLIDKVDTRSHASSQHCDYHASVCGERWSYHLDYDHLARLSGAHFALNQTVPHGTHGTAFDLRNVTYDRQGNITGLQRWAPTLSSPQGQLIDDLTYEYQDGTNRLEQVHDAIETDLTWDARPTEFLYDRNGNAVSITEELPGNETRMTAVTRLDERNLPERLSIMQPGQHLVVNYAYDLAGQRIKKHTYSGMISIPPGGGDPVPDPHYAVERYVRDGMRLVGVFDGDGNLKSWNIGGIAGLVGRMEYGSITVVDEEVAAALAEDELTAQSEDILLQSISQAAVDLGYDEKTAASIAGEVAPGAAQAVLLVALDAVEAAVAAWILRLEDPVGTTFYQLTVDTTTAIIEDSLATYDPTPGFAASVARYAGTYAASGHAEVVGDAVANSWVEQPSEHLNRRYYIADHLGSIRAVVNNLGHVLEARDHYPYGLMMPGRTFTAGQETREGYTGHELDAETGMYYAGARYYMPALARWTAVDPLADKFPAWSPYNYVMGNPLSLIDPDGRCSQPAGIGEGQVGICIGMFISSATIGGIGLGDNRGPVGDDPNATYRAQVQLVIDSSEGTIVSSDVSSGLTQVLLPTQRGPVPVGRKGSVDSYIGEPRRGEDGSVGITISVSAENGLSFLPFSPDSIDMVLELSVSSDGQVGILGGARDSYPSLEIFGYDSDGTHRLILHIPETSPRNLKPPMDQTLPTIAPR